MPKTTPKVHALASWHALQAQIHGFTEPQVAKLIEEELQGQRRRVIVLRLHMKLNKLRYAREKKELAKQTVLVRPRRG